MTILTIVTVICILLISAYFGYKAGKEISKEQ